MCQQPRRSKRKRLSPQEAQAERTRIAAAEAAERARGLQERQRIQRLAQQALIDAPPVTGNDRSDLDNMAYNIHTAYDWNGRGDQSVTAIIREANSQRFWVFPQRKMTAMWSYANKHYSDKAITIKPGCAVHHLHAEMYAVLYCLLNGWVPSEHIAEIGVSKPICPECAQVLRFLGIPFNNRWLTDKSSHDWKHPWDYLEKDCKPAVRDPRRGPDDDDDMSGGGGGPPFGGAQSLVV